MKHLIYLGICIAAQAVLADSFEREWASFDRDFERLNARAFRSDSTQKTQTKVAPRGEVQSASEAQVVESSSSNEKDVTEPLPEQEKLGYQIGDPKIRDKVLALYQRPDVVVKQFVIPFQ